VHGAHAARKRFDHEPTLAGLLNQAGYRTVAVSNNTWVSGEFGFDRGFDEFIATWQLFQDAVDFGDIAQTRTGTLDRLRGVLSKFRGNPAKNLANLVYGQFFRKRHDEGAGRTNEIVDGKISEWSNDDPLFLFLNYLEPHLEYRPPRRFATEWLPDGVGIEEARRVNQDAWAYVTGAVDMSERDFEILRGLYRAELAYLDTRLRELYELFEEAGVAEETLFVVTGDHGENIGDHGLMDHQYGLQETLLRVPLVLSGPGVAEDEQVKRPVQLVDLFPTMLDLADVAVPDELPGRSLVGGEGPPADRPTYAEYLAPQPPISTLESRYECRRDVGEFDRQLRTVRHEGWKYVAGSDGTEWLFDIGEDPGENSNLADERPEKLEHVGGRLEEWVGTLPEVESGTVSMDDETRNRLEDLGYLQ
jgi:arylsulfatase A-like enzyme